MKASDICVGDWIEDGYKKAQVTSITCDGIVETTAAISNIEVVEPIPLTEEILVKNGFEKRIYNPSRKSYHLPNFPLNWNDDDGFWFCDGIYTDYVHQLQHLLRLCGIEKELTI